LKEKGSAWAEILDKRQYGQENNYHKKQINALDKVWKK